MRPSPLALLLWLLWLLAAAGCAVWNPDYEPDPDRELQDLLRPARSAERALDQVTQERMRFSVERLATRHPSHVASQVAAAALSFEAGESQRAQGYLDRALTLAPAHVEARCLRARIAVADGSLDLARKLVDEGLRMRPDAAALYESSAWLHQLEGRFDDALRALSAAASLGAPAWRIAFHRGLVEELRGAFDAAERHYREAIEARPSCAEAKQRLMGLAARRQLAPGR
ncbi:MAG: tetratricopeptide repeat protein [Planctomycetota bacterium]